MTKDEFFELMASDEFEGHIGSDSWINEIFVDFFNKYNDDPDVFFEALKFHPAVLEFVCDDLKDNEEFMSYSIKEWGKDALFYASKRIKSDRSLVRLAI
jgi:hypothetical protein